MHGDHIEHGDQNNRHVGTHALKLQTCITQRTGTHGQIDIGEQKVSLQDEQRASPALLAL